jgi:hypothetical protein
MRFYQISKLHSTRNKHPSEETTNTLGKTLSNNLSDKN